jgi:hypothetical protein
MTRTLAGWFVRTATDDPTHVIYHSAVNHWVIWLAARVGRPAPAVYAALLNGDHITYDHGIYSIEADPPGGSNPVAGSNVPTATEGT